MNREELAWAAGLFEGEGCAYAGTARLGKFGSSPRLDLGMTDESTVRRFQAAVRCGTVTVRRYENHYKTLYVWRATGFENIQAVIAMLWPWMESRRRDKARETLESLKIRHGHFLASYPRVKNV